MKDVQSHRLDINEVIKLKYASGVVKLEPFNIIRF